jgi:hypothetical protein
MKGVCDDLVKSVKDGAPITPELHTVAKAFIQLQQHRHTADYDNSREWSRSEVDSVLGLLAGAFNAWDAIREQVEAQDFVLRLFLPKWPNR